MQDRELLEAAAKAAGLTIEYWAQEDYPVVRDGDKNVGWNPLTFDSDALRLAVKLEMIVDFSQDDGPLDVLPVIARGCIHDKTDPYSATRRSIVMCAAAMGEKA